MEVWNSLVAIAITAVIYHILLLVKTVVWEPLRLRRIMMKQGVKGPPFHLLVGNLPEALAFGQSQPEALALD